MYIFDKNLPSSSSLTDDDDSEDEDKRTIFCANLSERVSEEILCELFIQGGPVESVRIPVDRDGRRKNFGFVTYVHSCSVRYALRLFEGVRLFNQTLRIRQHNLNSNQQQQNNNKLSLTPPFLAQNTDQNSTKPLSKNDKTMKIQLSFDNSALRLGGNQSIRNTHIRFDTNLQPTKSSTKNNEKSKNPFKIDLDILSRLSSNLLPPKEKPQQQKSNNLNNPFSSSPKNNNRSHHGETTKRNRERDKFHPYKRSNVGDRSGGNNNSKHKFGGNKNKQNRRR